MSQQTDAPAFYASIVSFAATGADIKLVFMDSQPIVDTDGTIQEQRQLVQRGTVSMSFHTAKDLHALIGQALSDFEQNFGPIDTPYLRNR